MRDLCPLVAPLESFLQPSMAITITQRSSVRQNSQHHHAHTPIYRFNAVGSRGGPNFQSFQFRSTRALAQHDCTWGTRLNWEHNMHVKLSPTTKTYRTSPHLHRTRLAVAAMQVAEAKTVPGAGEAEMVDTAAEAAEMVVRAGKGKAAAMAAEAERRVVAVAVVDSSAL
jgi:hypothetical protein